MYTKSHQIALFKKKFRGACPRTPLAKRMASPCAACRKATCKFSNLKNVPALPPLSNPGYTPLPISSNFACLMLGCIHSENDGFRKKIMILVTIFATNCISCDMYKYGGLRGRIQGLAAPWWAKKDFFQIRKFAYRESKGVRGHAPPPRNLFKMVQFGAFGCIFGSDFVFKKFNKLPFFISKFQKLQFLYKNLKNYHFLYETFKNYHFLYKINKKHNFLYEKYMF